MNINQHHAHIDFEAFFQSQKDKYVGLDMNDFNIFRNANGEKHSFLGISDGENRVAEAISQAFSGKEADVLAPHISDMLALVFISPLAEKPLMMEEMSAINDFIEKLPSDVNVMWGLENDDTLGDSVKVILLVNAN